MDLVGSRPMGWTVERRKDPALQRVSHPVWIFQQKKKKKNEKSEKKKKKK